MAALGLVVLVAGFLPVPARAVELFGPSAVHLRAGGGVNKSVAVGDFNADGAQDLAVATADAVSIFFGDGLGGFSASTELPAGLGPSSVVIGDFNSDGAQDLAVANEFSDTVSIFLGDGRGGFASTPDLPVGVGPVSIAIGDFNNDGAQDLAVANFGSEGSETVSILLGDGFGGFPSTSILPAADGPTFVAIGDFNSDGAQDLAVVNRLSGTVSILLGDGRGGFASTPDLPVGVSPLSIAIGDFDANGSEDLAVASRTGSVNILLGDGLGGFSSTAQLPVGVAPHSVAIGDFNTDGALDLVFGHAKSIVSILLGDGLGGFPTPRTLSVGVSPVSIAVGDFDTDGAEDLAVANFDDDTVSILLGDGLGAFRSTTPLAVGDGPRRIAIGDFDCNTNLDLAVANLESETVTILLGDGLGEFRSTTPLVVGDGPRGIAIGDFNADGAQDLAVVNQDGGTVSIFLGDCRGGFSSTSEVPGGNRPVAVATADFNADGAQDLAIANSRGHTVSICLGDGLGGFPSCAELSVGRGPLSIAISDLNGDSALDLAVVGFIDNTVSILLGDGRGGFASTPDLPVSEGPGSVALGDFNDDGARDLAIAHFGADTVTVLLGDGLGGFSSLADLAVDRAPEDLAVGDFNGDGAQDLAVASLDIGTVNLLFNRLADRTDLNGSNRIDGFDLNEIGRRSGCGAEDLSDPCYRPNLDVNLDRTIDGDDLALVASRFGDIVNEISPLRASLDPGVPAPEPDRVTFQDGGTDGDRLTLQIVVNNTDDAVAAADFGVTFDPDILEFIGSSPGTYLAGEGVLQILTVRNPSPGLVTGTVRRLSGGVASPVVGAGPAALMNLILRARSAGATTVEFVPFQRSQPALLDSADQEVTGISFAGGAEIIVVASPEGPPGQRLGVAPVFLDFGSETPGGQVKKRIRISNFGFSDLTITGVTSLRPEFSTSFAKPFTISPFGFVWLPIVFAAPGPGLYSGELVIESDEPQGGEARVGLRGDSGLPLSVTPSRLDFKVTPLGGSKTLGATLENSGTTALTLTGSQSTDLRFLPEIFFSSLAPGESGRVQVGFQPVASVESHGFLTLTFDAPDGKTVVLRLVGTGGPDADGDGRGDEIDNCPAVANADQTDRDTDGVGDLCDNCRDVGNSDQLDSDADTVGDVCDPCRFDALDDVDADGVCGDVDNCPELANADQKDNDTDGQGDACDPDDDNDTVLDGADNCPFISNAGQTETDGDGFGDACDNCPDTFNPGQEDANDDGAGDACQPTVAIEAIQEDGGAELEVTVRLEDPNGDPITGSVRLRDLRIVLGDFLSDPDCTVLLAPESLPGQGIVFGIFGGRRFLLDADFATGALGLPVICQDGAQDYSLAVGACGVEGPPDASIDLDLVGDQLPGPICVRQVLNDLVGFDLEVVEIGAVEVLLHQLRSETAYVDSALPAGIDLSFLTPGRIYALEITATDGTTPEVADRREFLYQGETLMRFLSP